MGSAYLESLDAAADALDLAHRALAQGQTQTRGVEAADLTLVLSDITRVQLMVGALAAGERHRLGGASNGTP